MKEFLRQPFTSEEVTRALKHMHPFKSPGPDGMSPVFFQKFWHILKNDITNFVLDFLNNNSFVPTFNFTHIVLIPKVKNPETVTHFRPISLCNVVYKLASKVLSLRVRSTLPSIISESQSAFVPGRLITDNILVAYEIHHSMKARKHGNLGYMSIKLDMSKAFDRVEWSFILRVLSALGFPNSIVDLIKTCITTTSFSFLLNGTQFGYLHPQRGIRQGDPLSPYLFILCSEVFSLILQDLQAAGNIHGLAINKHAPTISHLFFADDTLLFGHASIQEAKYIKYAIQLYESVSGQKINFEKSGILFSPNTQEDIQASISQLLNIPVVSSHGKYLGLPSVIGANKKQVFSSILDRCWSRLQGWKEKQLSQAGRIVLIQSVIQSIPTFAMMCFKLPDGIIEKIHSMSARYLWGGDPEKRAIHWKSWDRLCVSKSHGGLGFRHLRAFNLALLSKQAWRILTCKSSLIARIFKAKYFPHSNILDSKLGHRPSWSWRSIFESVKCLKLGCRKFIKSGSSTKIWDDPWLPHTSDFKVHSPRPINTHFSHVADLIDHEHGTWKLDIITSLFIDSEAKAILSIPMGSCSTPDFWGWNLSKNGKFTTKTAYHRILESDFISNHTSAQNSSGSDNLVWKKIWKLKIPHRSQYFLWRCISRALPTPDFLSLHHIPNSDPCELCSHAHPSAAHIFFTCPFAASSWKMVGLWDCIIYHEQPSFSLWLRDIILTLKADMCELFAVICDHIWFSRNKKKFEQLNSNPFSCVLTANNTLLDFNAANGWPERPSTDLKAHCLAEKKPLGPRIFFDGAISKIYAGIESQI
ncbi:hypothetical protein DH2020_046910 [Rehmannia glutinosa]|uniref:Reverse transcriptase domain-containing protein n=1 Tax=Rehmannia glutinosa TaxID=99300 RepID=A0ABR0U9Z0_REHGL